MSQSGQKDTSLMISLMKKRDPHFFSLQIQRLAESLQGLNSSLVQSAKEICGW